MGRGAIRLSLLTVLALGMAAGPARAQQAAPPPAVGVVPAMRQPMTQVSEHIGRVQAPERVNIVARVTAALEQKLFADGAEVKKGDLLYRLEQGPFQAEVQAKRASVAQFRAQLQNATVALGRAKSLLNTPAGQPASVDTALANQQSLQAQVQGAEAQLQQALINLGYTEIRAPIDGKIGRTAMTVGNYVSPTSGVLAVIVSQDPMFVTFPISTRTALDLRRRSFDKGGLAAVLIKLRLPDGRLYEHEGALDFIDNSIGGNTDTIALRGTVPNPLLPASKGDGNARELIDGELVTVILQDTEPVLTLAIPRSAVLSDQAGDYTYVVDGSDKAQQRRIRLGQSTPTIAAVVSGLTEGESVIVEGVQRVRPGQPVKPGPANLAWPPPPQISADPPGPATPGAPPRRS